MKHSGAVGLLSLGVILGVVAPDSRAAAPDALAKVPTLRAAEAEQVREQALAWLAERDADGALRAAADAIWQTGSGPYAQAAVLERLAASIALADPPTRQLIALCSQPRPLAALPGQEWLTDEKIAPLVRHNLRLFYGRWLSQQALYDEALAQLDGLQPADVVDPAALLFYQSVAHHRLLNKEQGLKTIERLLTETVDSPPRYVTVAGLMQADLKTLEDDSLDHISRRMDDIRRRLDLGRAGQKVRSEEDGVIASLDKLIEELEKQQQQQSGSGGGGAMQPSTPMQDSRLAGAKAPGDTQRRNLGKSAGWGDLPAKQREQALQAIGKDFPSHYRDVIEQYFRKLASEEGAPER